MISTAHAVLSTSVQVNCSLRSEYEQFARVTVERTPPRSMFSDRCGSTV